jgi:sigma-E factor negative regulatory protein RseC
MTEHGLVIDTDDGIARVSLDRSADCAKCNACCIGKDRNMFAEVDNTVDAKKGDHVIVEVSDRQAVKAVLLTLGLPLLVLVAGAIVFSSLAQGMGFGDSGEIIGGLAGFVLMVLVFIGIRRYDQRIRKRRSSNMKIVKIIRT